MAKKRAKKSLDELLEEAIVKEDERPYEVPGNWVWVKLEELFDITSSKRVFKTEWKSSGIPFYRAREIAELSVKDKIDNELFISKEMYEDYSKKYGVPKAGDILITAVGTLGKVYIVKTNDKFYFKDGNVIWLKKKNTLLKSSIIKYFFESFFMLKKIQNISTGTVVKTYTITKAKGTLFPLPPLPEQKRIVKKLSSMLGRLKEARELIREAKDTFEKRRAAILNKAFTGELTKKWREETPDVESAEKHLHNSFESVKNQYQKECLDCKLKGIRKPKRPEILRYFSQDKIGDLSEIGLTGWCETDFVNFCILQRGFDLPTTKRIKGKHPVVSSSGIIDYHIESKVKGPGFTVGRSGSVGKTYFVEEDYWPLNTTLFSKELNGNDPKYAFYYLSAFDFLKFSSSTAVPTLNRNNFSDVSIKIPPLSEQKEIVRILENLLDHEDEARALIDIEEQIDLLGKSILSKAFRGELGTNDTNDEPAIELLKRSLKEKNELKE